MGVCQFIFKYDDEYPLVFAPWDLDIIFGNYSALPHFNDVSNQHIINNPLFEKLYNLNIDNYRERIKFKWNEIKAILSYSQIYDDFYEHIDKLIESNAIIRENDKWNIDIDLDDELNLLNSWLIERIQVFDNYIISNY